MNNTIQTKILIKRGLEENLKDYILAEGEFGYAIDSKKVKMGNGTTIFSELPTIITTDDKKAIEDNVLELSGKIDDLSANLNTLVKWDSIKPENGIVKSDLTEDVQQSLKKADTALQQEDLDDYAKVDDVENLVNESKTELNSKITDLETDITTNNNAITEETTRAKAKEDELDNEIDNLKTDLDSVNSKVNGLKGALHYKGQQDSIPTDNTDFESGDVIVVKHIEYVFNGETWAEFGADGDWLLKEEANQTYILKSGDTFTGEVKIPFNSLKDETGNIGSNWADRLDDTRVASEGQIEEIMEAVEAAFSDFQSNLDNKANAGHTHQVATETTSGFMSAEDKKKLNNIDKTSKYHYYIVKSKEETLVSVLKQFASEWEEDEEGNVSKLYFEGTIVVIIPKQIGEEYNAQYNFYYNDGIQDFSDGGLITIKMTSQVNATALDTDYQYIEIETTTFADGRKYYSTEASWKHLSMDGMEGVCRDSTPANEYEVTQTYPITKLDSKLLHRFNQYRKSYNFIISDANTQYKPSVEIIKYLPEDYELDTNAVLSITIDADNSYHVGTNTKLSGIYELTDCLGNKWISCGEDTSKGIGVVGTYPPLWRKILSNGEVISSNNESGPTIVSCEVIDYVEDEPDDPESTKPGLYTTGGGFISWNDLISKYSEVLKVSDNGKVSLALSDLESEENIAKYTPYQKELMGNNLVLPNTITSIGDNTFAWTSLDKVYIPNSVSEIGSGAFTESNLIYCEAQSQPKDWDESWAAQYSIPPVVWDCKNNDIADNGYIYYTAEDGIRYQLKDGEVAVSSMQSVTLGGDIIVASNILYKGITYKVTQVKKFYTLKTITSLTIPSSITKVNLDSLLDNDGLEIVYWEIDRPENDLVVRPKPVVFGECVEKGATLDGLNWVLTKSGTITIIGHEDKENLVELEIPGQINGYPVISICSAAFYSCEKLETVIFKETTHLTDIEEAAFWGCSNLKNIIIPSSVLAIRYGAFWSCRNLTELVFENNSNLKYIGMSAFNSSGLSSIVIPNTVTTIGDWAFNTYNLTNIVIPHSVINMGFSIVGTNENLTIYCEAESKPSGWHKDWNSWNNPVVWGYKS